MMYHKFQSTHGRISVIRSRMGYDDKRGWGGVKIYIRVLFLVVTVIHRVKGHTIVSPSCLKVLEVVRW